MTRQAKDEVHEERIHMEIIVDAYRPEEQAMGWYNYLDDTLQSPFTNISSGFQAKALDAQRELDKRASYTSFRPYSEAYVPVLNKAKGMCARKTTASNVLLIGSQANNNLSGLQVIAT